MKNIYQLKRRDVLNSEIFPRHVYVILTEALEFSIFFLLRIAFVFVFYLQWMLLS